VHEWASGGDERNGQQVIAAGLVDVISGLAERESTSS
jgi:hypothetical protein